MENATPNTSPDTATNTPIDTTSLTDIYLQLSEVPFFESFDYSVNQDEVSNVMSEIYIAKFKAIDSIELQRNAILINKSFAKLVSSFTKNRHHIGFLFLEYCFYFDLELNVTHKHLHPKIQKEISAYLETIIGSKNYNSIMSKLNTNHGIKTLMDLIPNTNTKQANEISINYTYSLKHFKYVKNTTQI